MDRSLVAEKLESLRRCVTRIEAKCPADASTLASDLDLQDIVSVNLTRAVQLCVDIASHIIANSGHNAPSTMGEAFDVLVEDGIIDANVGVQLRKAVGFRNIATHSYEKMNWDIVYALCKQAPDDFKRFAKQLSAKL